MRRIVHCEDIVQPDFVSLFVITILQDSQLTTFQYTLTLMYTNTHSKGAISVLSSFACGAFGLPAPWALGAVEWPCALVPCVCTLLPRHLNQ
jgi:hypothetical protein